MTIADLDDEEWSTDDSEDEDAVVDGSDDEEYDLSLYSHAESNLLSKAENYP